MQHEIAVSPLTLEKQDVGRNVQKKKKNILRVPFSDISFDCIPGFRKEGTWRRETQRKTKAPERRLDAAVTWRIGVWVLDIPLSYQGHLSQTQRFLSLSLSLDSQV